MVGTSANPAAPADPALPPLPAADPARVSGFRPALGFAPELLLQAQGTATGLKAAIFDVDGVLTDGSLHISAQGEEVKVFHALDGHGLKLLARGGILPIVITGRDSPAVRRRVADLGLTHASYGAADKLAVAEGWLRQLGLGWHEVAVIGDDWPDLPLLLRAAFACVPANAHAECQAVAHHVTALRGGAGAAREFCDLLLMAAGRYDALLAGHLTTLDGA